MTGWVFNIQRFSIHDGPGIRTTVFLKGCSLNCFWCHNPESIKARQEIQYLEDRCIGCGQCIKVCRSKTRYLVGGCYQYDKDKCSLCKDCVNICPVQALTVVGERMTVAGVMEKIQRDVVFYRNSGGGVTISGGEPLLQVDFAVRILEACKERGISTAVDTAGNVPWENIERVIPYTDLFLYDIKAGDYQKHLKATGHMNKRIISNVLRLHDREAKIIIRIPVIPGVNDSLEDMDTIVSNIKPLAVDTMIELLPFHKLAASKYYSLGLKYPAQHLDTPDKDTIKALAKALEGGGFTVKYSKQ